MPKAIPSRMRVVVYANLDNGQKYTLKTNKKGEYFSLGITPGKYNVTLYKSADDQKAGQGNGPRQRLPGPTRREHSRF